MHIKSEKYRFYMHEVLYMMYEIRKAVREVSKYAISA